MTASDSDDGNGDGSHLVQVRLRGDTSNRALGWSASSFAGDGVMRALPSAFLLPNGLAVFNPLTVFRRVPVTTTDAGVAIFMLQLYQSDTAGLTASYVGVHRRERDGNVLSPTSTNPLYFTWDSATGVLTPVAEQTCDTFDFHIYGVDRPSFVRYDTGSDRWMLCTAPTLRTSNTACDLTPVAAVVPTTPDVLGNCNGTGSPVPDLQSGLYYCACGNGLVPNPTSGTCMFPPCSDARPCENGGTCRSGACQCPTGWGGPRCDVACTDDCGPHGQCTGQPSMPCLCTDGYSGPQCTVPPGDTGTTHWWQRVPLPVVLAVVVGVVLVALVMVRLRRTQRAVAREMAVAQHNALLRQAAIAQQYAAV